MVPVPDGLEHLVREPQVDDVLDRLLPEEVVDPEDLFVVQHQEEPLVELAGRSQVVAERLLDHDPGAIRQPGAADLLDDRANSDGGVAR